MAAEALVELSPCLFPWLLSYFDFGGRRRHNRCIHVLSKTTFVTLRRVLVCALLASPVAFAQPSAGRISALVPAASRNNAVARLQEELEWNDRLRTDAAGRMRAWLGDGSVLSLGAATELTVVQHDATSQQTQIELAYGKLRSMVTPLRQPGSVFRIKTPNVAVGVVGTDFYLESEKDHFLLICFSGTVWAERSGEKYTVKAGQMLELEGGAKGTVRKASAEVTRGALRETAIAQTLDLAPAARLEARLTTAVDATKVREGTEVIAKVTRDVRVGSAVVVAKGSELVGAVTEVSQKDREHKESQLGIAFTELRLSDGQSFPVSSVIDSVASETAPPDDMEGGFGDATQSLLSDASGGSGQSSAGSSRTLGSTVGTVTRTAGTAATPVTRTASSVSPLGGVQRGASPSVLAGLALPDVNITPKISDTGSGAVFTSTRNVRLPKGTVLVVRTLAQ